jgi:hypothetical protein
MVLIMEAPVLPITQVPTMSSFLPTGSKEHSAVTAKQMTQTLLRPT